MVLNVLKNDNEGISGLIEIFKFMYEIVYFDL